MRSPSCVFLSSSLSSFSGLLTTSSQTQEIMKVSFSSCHESNPRHELVLSFLNIFSIIDTDCKGMSAIIQLQKPSLQSFVAVPLKSSAGDVSPFADDL